MADALSTLEATTPAAGPSLAQRNAERTRADLLAAAEAVLLRGEDLTMRAVAAAAGVGERTIYRYFESRDALLDATAGYIGPRIGAPLCDTADGLEQYAADLFGTFEANRALTVATVTTPWCQAFLGPSRAANLEALTVLLRRAFPAAPGHDLDAAAASLRTVLSGAGWVYQRVSCELPAEQVTANATWLVRLVLERLGALERPSG
jgi:AcrR family transcriptional regulator